MKWCRFQTAEGSSYGIIEGDNVIQVTGDPIRGSYERTSNSQPLGEVKLLVPVIPPTFYAAGINFREHVQEMAEKRGEEPQFPDAADVGYRANNALVAEGEAIVVPSDAHEQLQYEGELVVIIGKQCKNVSEEEALDYVLATP